MSSGLIKNKSNKTLIEEYLNNITSRCEEKMPIVNPAVALFIHIDPILTNIKKYTIKITPMEKL